MKKRAISGCLSQIEYYLDRIDNLDNREKMEFTDKVQKEIEKYRDELKKFTNTAK